MEWPLRLAIPPSLLLDETIDGVQTLRGKRMRTKISIESLDGDLGQFLLGSAGVDHIFLMQPLQLLEKPNRAIGRISSSHRKHRAGTVGFEFLIFRVSHLPDF